MAPLRVLADRRLWLAILASLLLHLWLVAGSGDWLPEWHAGETPIQVTLAIPPPPAPPRAVPISAPAARPKTVATPAKRPPPAAAPPAPAPTATATPAATVEAPASEQPAASEAEPVPIGPLADAPAPPAPEQPDAHAPEETTALSRPLPQRVELEYQVDYQGASGTEKHWYAAAADGTYRISSRAEPKGLASLVVADLAQESEGRITARGLVPGSFVYQYGNKTQQAWFDWQNQSLALDNKGKKQTFPLQPGTQDVLSFMYQFMFVPPLEELELAITNGKSLRTYRYNFEGETEISTGIGKTTTLHISRQGSKGEEKDELWLAPDYFYLPVKIRGTDKDGKIVLRTLEKIRITP